MFTHLHGTGEQVVGIVFPSVTLDASNTVTQASILFITDEVHEADGEARSDEEVLISIYGQSGPAAFPTLAAKDLTSRPVCRRLTPLTIPSRFYTIHTKFRTISPIFCYQVYAYL